MKDLHNIISCLEQSPKILSSMIEDIPFELLKTARKPGKWSIHENACHLSQAEHMINGRFTKFVEFENPAFEPYLPGSTVEENLLSLDLHDELAHFKQLRADTVDLLKMYDPSIWSRKANHPQYSKYDARILARHTLMHDHFHMYRIEELWLTKDEFLLA